jgi:hypothetical protein
MCLTRAGGISVVLGVGATGGGDGVGVGDGGGGELPHAAASITTKTVLRITDGL